MKFKKHCCIFLAFFLLVSNIGFAFNVHYCGDTIASISLKTAFSDTDSEKDCCGIAEKKSGCCKDKVFHFQKKSDQATVIDFTSHSDAFVLPSEWQPFVFNTTVNYKNAALLAYSFDANAPPLFQLYHQYIFYF